MGYGPAVENKFGWCWRTEHGSGKRMTPYFPTEDSANKFHDYMDDYTFIMDYPKCGIDLRCTKLKDVNEIARNYASENNIKIIINPRGETLREFYGVDQEMYVGYRDPTPYPWQSEDEDEDEDNSDEEEDEEEEND